MSWVILLCRDTPVGEYKFIFAQLERLSAGDTIYVNYNGTRYTYAVTRLETVNPDQADKLIYPFERPMLTLVTCTPVGTAKYRLLVVAEQVNPSGSVPPVAIPDDGKSDNSGIGAAKMPANSPTLLENISSSLLSWKG